MRYDYTPKPAGKDDALFDVRHELQKLSDNLLYKSEKDPWKVISQTYTIRNGERILAVLSGAVTLSLPPAPKVGSEVEVQVIGGYPAAGTSYNLTIGRNGNNIDSRAEDLLVNVDNGKFKFIYVSDAIGWMVG